MEREPGSSPIVWCCLSVAMVLAAGVSSLSTSAAQTRQSVESGVLKTTVDGTLTVPAGAILGSFLSTDMQVSSDPAKQPLGERSKSQAGRDTDDTDPVRSGASVQRAEEDVETKRARLAAIQWMVRELVQLNADAAVTPTDPERRPLIDGLADDEKFTVESFLRPLRDGMLDTLRGIKTGSSRSARDSKEAWRKECQLSLKAADEWTDLQFEVENPAFSVSDNFFWRGETEQTIRGGVIFLVVGWGLAMHVRRRRIRRMLRAIKLGASTFERRSRQMIGWGVILIAAGVVTTALFSDKITTGELSGRPLSIADQVSVRDEVARSDLASLRREETKINDELLQSRQELTRIWDLRIGSKQLSKDDDSARSEAWPLVLAIVEARRIGEAFVELTAKRAEERRDYQQKRTERLQARQAALHDNFMMNSVIVAAFLCVALVPLMVSLIRVWSESSRSRRSCARCNKTKLTVGKKKTTCDECGFEMLNAYAPLQRVCFPTVGVVGSGKTMWLLTVWDLMRRKVVPDRLRLSCLHTNQDRKLVDRIEDAWKGVSEPTQDAAIPVPLPILVSDNASIVQRTQARMMLFDYGGEMIHRSHTEGPPRERALKMDGFVLFLDPTTTDDPIENVLALRDQIRNDRGLVGDQRIDVPVAVCLSKMDLCVSYGLGPLLGRQFVQEVKSVGHKKNKIDLRVIDERHRICCEFVSKLFDGWGVHKELDESFGGSFRFFPMSSVGITKDELGEEDITKRTRHPFGVLEPIFWLLHMQGFSIFDLDGVEEDFFRIINS